MHHAGSQRQSGPGKAAHFEPVCTLQNDVHLKHLTAVLQEHAMAAARLAAAALAEGHAGRELLALEAQLTELTAKR